jgi:hypothetical protein
VIEGNQPATLTEPRLLVVAPLWLVRRIFRAS